MKKLLLTAFVFIMFVHGFAQNLNLQGVLNVKLKNTGVITSGTEVKGYYYFYNVDKTDSKNYNYIIKITDENLREINSVEIVRPRSFALIEAEYNGDAFAFLFYNPKQNSAELITYDKSLKQTGTVTKKIVGITDQYFKMAASGQDATHAFLVAVEGKGFLYYGFAESKKIKYTVELYDNNLKQLWATGAADIESKEVEMADDAFQSDKYIGTLITRKASMTSKDFSYDLLVNDINTGKQVFKMELADKEYNISASKIAFDEKTGDIMVFGEYYNLKDKEAKAASLGYFYLMLDETGKVVERKILSWEKEMAKVIPVDKSGKMDKGARVFVHEIIRNADGDVFVVGEQYKKAASGWGIAMAAMGGGRSRTATVQLEVMNMVVFQFSPSLDIKGVQIFEKDPHFHLLPAGSEWLSAKMLAYLAKAAGWFDFAFSQISKDKETFMVAYINYDKEKGEKAKNVLGVIVYTPEKTFTVDKTPLNRKSTDYLVRRAKTGYVFIAEYFRKEKKIDSRLEKINY